jgi:hypothetical protein
MRKNVQFEVRLAADADETEIALVEHTLNEAHIFIQILMKVCMCVCVCVCYA